MFYATTSNAMHGLNIGFRHLFPFITLYPSLDYGSIVHLIHDRLLWLFPPRLWHLTPGIRRSVHTALRLHRRVARVPHGRLTQHEGGGVFLSLPHPLCAAPQALDRGENRFISVPIARPAG